MSNGKSTKWRFLIVEDKPDIAKQLEEACPGFVAPDAAEADVCSKFKEAEPLLDSHRYDLLIIDLKDDSSNLPDTDNLPGLKVFEEVKKTAFCACRFLHGSSEACFARTDSLFARSGKKQKDC